MRTMALMASALVAAAGGVWAQEPTTVIGESLHVERLAYQPGDLASAAGVRDLRGRVRGAAHRVCDLGVASQTAEYRERTCYQATLPEAMAQVDQAVARLARGEAPQGMRIVVAAR